MQPKSSAAHLFSLECPAFPASESLLKLFLWPVCETTNAPSICAESMNEWPILGSFALISPWPRSCYRFPWQKLLSLWLQNICLPVSLRSEGISFCLWFVSSWRLCLLEPECHSNLDHSEAGVPGRCFSMSTHWSIAACLLLAEHGQGSPEDVAEKAGRCQVLGEMQCQAWSL